MTLWEANKSLLELGGHSGISKEMSRVSEVEGLLQISLLFLLIKFNDHGSATIETDKTFTAAGNFIFIYAHCKRVGSMNVKH